MAKFRVVTVETTTYEYFVEAANEDEIWEDFDPSEGGKEVDHDFDVVEVQEAEEVK